MTCVAALITDGVVYMGADSAGTDCWNGQRVLNTPKLFRVGNALLGCAGSIRVAQALRFASPPGEHKRMPLEKYLNTVFVDWMRDALLRGGVAEKKDNVEGADSAVLVGIKGHVFTVEEDFNVTENLQPYSAVGSGAQVAMGALFARKEGSPRARILTALKAAAAFDSTCRPPFRLETL